MVSACVSNDLFSPAEYEAPHEEGRGAVFALRVLGSFHVPCLFKVLCLKVTLWNYLFMIF